MTDLTDLELLFNRAPPYTDAELASIISVMRDQRALVATGKRPAKEKGPQKDMEGTKLLDQLGLGKPKPTGNVL